MILPHRSFRRVMELPAGYGIDRISQHPTT